MNRGLPPLEPRKQSHIWLWLYLVTRNGGGGEQILRVGSVMIAIV
jgi:hypothetical protein